MRGARRWATVAALTSLGPAGILAGCGAPIDEDELADSFGSLRAVAHHELDCRDPLVDSHECTAFVTMARDADAGDIAAAIEVGEKLHRDALVVEIDTTRRDGAHPGASVRFTEDVAEGPVSEVLEHVTKHPSFGSVRVNVDPKPGIDYVPRPGAKPAHVLGRAHKLVELGDGMALTVDGDLRLASAKGAWPTHEAELFRAATEKFPHVVGGVIGEGAVLVRLRKGQDAAPVQAFLTGHPSYDGSDTVLATSDPRIDLSSPSISDRQAVEVATRLSALPGWTSAQTDGATLRVVVDGLGVARDIHEGLGAPRPDAGGKEGGDQEGGDQEGGGQLTVDYRVGSGTSVQASAGDPAPFAVAEPLATAEAFDFVTVTMRGSGSLVRVVAAPGARPRQLGRLLRAAWSGAGSNQEPPVTFELAWSEVPGRKVTFEGAPTLRPTGPGPDSAGPDGSASLPSSLLRQLKQGWREVRR